MHVRLRSVGRVLARAVTHALVGLEPRRVEVEAHLAGRRCRRFAIVGLADRACQEAKQRVRSGIVSAELSGPTVAGSPSTSRRRSCARKAPGFDLPIALAVLAGVAPAPARARCRARACRRARARRAGAAGRRRARRRRGRAPAGLTRLLCAAESAPRRRSPGSSRSGASPRRGGRVPARRAASRRRSARADGDEPRRRLPDLAEVRGQERGAPRARARGGGRSQPAARRAAGNRARRCSRRRLPGILPPLTRDEALEVTRIHSVAGLLAARAPLVGSCRRFGRRITARRPRRSSAAGRGPDPARRASPTVACCSSTSWPSSRGRCSRRCASRSKTASSRSPGSAGSASSRRASSSSRR